MLKSLPLLFSAPFLAKYMPLFIKIFLAKEEESHRTEDSWERQYDYIIVGSSPAGCVLANRLSENPRQKVLLLEAGPPYNKLAEIPALDFLFPGSAYTDDYLTEPQPKSCFGIVGRECPITRGKGLGGTTNIDTNIYMRGDPREYNSWTKLGLRNWRYDANLPYHLMVERMLDYQPYQYRFYGTQGYLPIGHDPYQNLVTEAIERGSRELKYLYGDPHTMAESILFKPLMIQRGSTRFSAYRSYVEPILSRPNLKIVTYAEVTKINFHGKRAVSVTFKRLETYDTVYARKEIILSAGPISSPKLLMLSGIGPEYLLKSYDIPVVSALEGVGRNLVSPLCALGLNYEVRGPASSYLHQSLDEEEFEKYERNGTGRFSTTGYDVAGLLSSYVYGFNETGYYPDIQLMLYTGGLVSNDGSWNKKRYRIDPKTWATVFEPYEKTHSFTLMACIVRPLSRGVVEISSSDPYSSPVIDPKYNSNPRDLQALSNGLKMALRIAHTKPVLDLDAHLYTTVIPSCREYALYSDPYVACSAQSVVTPSMYMAGTCRMGHPSDPRSVVNSYLQVKGVEGLRVADASVLPSVPALSSGPEYMIGEKLYGYLSNLKPPIYAGQNLAPPATGQRIHQVYG